MSSSPRSPPGSWGHWCPTVATGGCHPACHNGPATRRRQDFLCRSRAPRPSPSGPRGTRRGAQTSRPWQALASPLATPERPVATRAWGPGNPLPALRASIAGGLAIGCAPVGTVHDATIAARVVHPVAQPRCLSDPVDALARPLRSRPVQGSGNLHAPPGSLEARHAGGSERAGAQGASTDSPRGRPSRLGRRRPGALSSLVVRDRWPATAVAYSAIAADAGRTTRLTATACPTRPARTTVMPEAIPTSHPAAAKTPDAPDTHGRTSTPRTPEPVPHPGIGAPRDTSPSLAGRCVPTACPVEEE